MDILTCLVRGWPFSNRIEPDDDRPCIRTLADIVIPSRLVYKNSIRCSVHISLIWSRRRLDEDQTTSTLLKKPTRPRGRLAAEFGFDCPRFRRDRLGSLHASACLHPSAIRPSSRHYLISLPRSSSEARGRVAFLQKSQTGRILSDEGMKPHRNRSSINLRCCAVMQDVCGLNGRPTSSFLAADTSAQTLQCRGVSVVHLRSLCRLRRIYARAQIDTLVPYSGTAA